MSLFGLRGPDRSIGDFFGFMLARFVFSSRLHVLCRILTLFLWVAICQISMILRDMVVYSGVDRMGGLLQVKTLKSKGID